MVDIGTMLRSCSVKGMCERGLNYRSVVNREGNPLDKVGLFDLVSC